jgi:hypothetical protein
MVDVPSNFATDARFEGNIKSNETRAGSFSSPWISPGTRTGSKCAW